MLDRLEEEILQSRRKYPANNLLLAALMEEVGELSAALRRETKEDIVTEAMHVACLAVRIAEEGDKEITQWRCDREKAFEDHKSSILQLRCFTGEKLTVCQRALEATGWDVQKAIDFIREGLTRKRQNRDA